MSSTATVQEGLTRKFQADKLNVYVYESRPAMGKAAASVIASEIRQLIEARGRAVVIFASAPSQNEFLENLVAEPGIDWTQVIAFHLDEYLGMSETAPQSFRRFLIDRLGNKVALGEFNGLRGESANGDAEAKRYADLLKANPPDIGVLGIGENGHLAFIDPPFCNFNDPEAVKVVELDEVCRQQQVNDGAFKSLDEVPRNALSLTIPTLMERPKLFAIAPGPAKRQAIKGAVEGAISTTCPASILRTHPDAHLFIDVVAAELLESN
jgi:glucosamine-6-phosphate deaminase